MNETIEKAQIAINDMMGILEISDERETRGRVAFLLWHISSLMASSMSHLNLEEDRIKVDALAIEIAAHAGMDFNEICDKYNDGIPT